VREASVQTFSRLAAVTSTVFCLALLAGCRGRVSPPADEAKGPPPTPEAAQASQELGGLLSDLINESNVRFRPLEYEYNEDLLKILDQFERYDSGKAPGPAPRAMPKLDEEEELAHLRETVRRWQAKTGKNLRAEVDKLKAEVAARKAGGPAFHPEFQKHFSAVFDDFINPFEVDEIRERRNRYLHEKMRPLLDAYREKCPAYVREQEDFFNQPPYNLPSSGSARAETRTSP